MLASCTLSACGLLLDLSGSDPVARDAGDAASTADAGIDADDLVDAGEIDAVEPLPSSCAEIAARDPSAVDGEHEIEVGGTILRVWCDIGGGGWTRVADVDAATGSCPAGWEPLADPPVCWVSPAGCAPPVERPVSFDVPLATYTEVRGYVAGHQFGTTDAFKPSEAGGASVDSVYVDGVSITVGTPRAHVWTYASGVFATGGDTNRQTCPCEGGVAAPGFVGERHHCDSANDARSLSIVWHGAIWDETGTDAACATGASPMWFETALDVATSAPLEVRIMHDQCDETVGVARVQLWAR